MVRMWGIYEPEVNWKDEDKLKQIDLLVNAT